MSLDPRRRLNLVPALLAFLAFFASLPMPCRADVKLPAIFTDHMVLQRDQPNRVWGWAEPDEAVTVTIGEQKHSAKAGKDRRWEVKLEALSVGGPHQLTVQGKNELTVDDVLVGEVWICSGQSNMQWPVSRAMDADMEKLTANYPRIRLISVPQVGTQDPQYDFKGQWSLCTPESVENFSAVGYFFGRELYQALDVPIGLINDAWGGSACEAWIPRETLAGDARYAPLLESWKKIESSFEPAKMAQQYKRQAEKWKEDVKQAQAAGKQPPPHPRPPQNILVGNARPGNIYNGVLLPTIGYGIRGVIWYQGETNAGRAYQYRHLFPLMIQTWRDKWHQNDFPFYWVQLADYMAEKPEPADSAWAELREAQTLTMNKLPNTGQAVIIDLGEGNDIHPRNKQEVGMRLARWALARDYGKNLVYQSPLYKSYEVRGDKVLISIDHVGGGLRTVDTKELEGFAIAGEDKKFVWANAQLVGRNQIEVSSKDVPKPAAVRYAWADNPVANVTSQEGLPLTPFRTDDWPGVTADAVAR